MNPAPLIDVARSLAVNSGATRPKQWYLRRAVSTSYYAMFHTLCKNVADLMIGGGGANRSVPAWRQAYRAISHTEAKKACENKTFIRKFPKEIEDFAEEFTQAQIRREKADYDPDASYKRSDVILQIEVVERAISNFNKVRDKHRRAFAAWVVFKNRSN